MPDSLLELLAQYFQAQIDAPGKPEGLVVERQRSLPINEDLLPAALIYVLRETATKIQGRSTVMRREVVIRVELRAAGEPSDQLLDPLRQWVVSQMAVDFKCGGLAKEIEEISSQWDQKAEDLVVGASAIDYRVTYYTKVDDLTSL
jgi:hypothetical protein